MNRFIFSALFVFFLQPQQNSLAAESCEFPRFVLGGASVELSPWVPRDGDILMRGVRSNAPHYWSWAHKFLGQGYVVLRPEEQGLLQKLVQFEGLLAGDSHQENSGWLRPSRGAELIYAPNDRDDWGFGPFLLSYIKFLGVTESVVDWVKSDSNLKRAKYESLINGRNGKMLRAYLDGLKLGMGVDAGTINEIAMPKALLKLQSKARSNFERDHAEEINSRIKGKAEAVDAFLADKTAGFSFRFGRKGLMDPAKLNSTAKERKVFDAARPAIEARLQELGFQALSVAVRVEEDGGWEDMIRILYLGEHSGQLEILEFKQQVGTALDRFVLQPAMELIQAEGRELFWLGKSFALRGEVKVDDCLFFTMRPLEPGYNQLSVKPKKDGELKNFMEISLFQAQQMGMYHGRQLIGNADYSDLVEAKFDETKELLKEVTRLYLRIAKESHQP